MVNKTPIDLAAEMNRMAELHANTIWAQVMREGAAMILVLNDITNSLGTLSGWNSTGQHE